MRAPESDTFLLALARAAHIKAVQLFIFSLQSRILLWTIKYQAGQGEREETHLIWSRMTRGGDEIWAFSPSRHSPASQRLWIIKIFSIERTKGVFLALRRRMLCTSAQQKQRVVALCLSLLLVLMPFSICSTCPNKKGRRGCLHDSWCLICRNWSAFSQRAGRQSPVFFIVSHSRLCSVRALCALLETRSTALRSAGHILLPSGSGNPPACQLNWIALIFTSQTMQDTNSAPTNLPRISIYLTSMYHIKHFIFCVKMWNKYYLNA